jgi:uncharacterized surface protein with fasciclin (FAS1) repeats
MRNFPKNIQGRLARILPVLVLAISALVSCSDPYFYDDREPSWLGGSIYSYLQDHKTYKTTLRLIDTLDYTQDMKLTGSKTLFVANDSAYDVFFQNNSWGVKRFEDLSLAQMKFLLKFSMIDNAYLLQTMVNYYDATSNTTYENSAMRRLTALTALDSITEDFEGKIPENKYWDPYKTRGIHIMKDATDMPCVFYTQDFLTMNSITNEDFSLISHGMSRNMGDVHVFDDKVVTPNVVCKNGYIHVLDHVLTAPQNMAQYIENTDTTKGYSTRIFAKLIDRFCAPYFDKAITVKYNQLPGRPYIDSIFVKHYFGLTSTGGRITLPSGVAISSDFYLPFDPGWNSYQSTTIYPDMAAMFVPTDEAMTAYFNSGVGSILKSRFGRWEDVPDKIIIPFLKRHMRSSFIESVSSRFGKMVDTENYRLPVEPSQIASAYSAVNGVVYLTNAVYPPVDYISVYSPILLSPNTNIYNWAINRTEDGYGGTKFAFYKLYINSLVSRYSVFVPTDEYFSTYIDPIAYGQDAPQGGLKFKYNAKTEKVYGVICTFNKNVYPPVFSDSVGVITDEAFLQDRLWKLLDSHIVVGDVESGNNYFVTKGNDLIKVEGSGSNMTVAGGYDIEKSTPSEVKKIFRQENGNTYFINKPIQPSLRSVYKVLSETDGFRKFYDVLNGVPDTCVYKIFSPQGVDFKVNFFNAYRYTIYVPTDSAMQSAIDRRLILPWDSIYAMPQSPMQAQEINKVIRFLRYHFQDDAVFFGQSTDEIYQSATIKNDNLRTHFLTGKNRYYKIGVQGNSNSMTLTTETNLTAHVSADPRMHNIIAKDYIFSKVPTAFKNVDGSGASTAAAFISSSITTSASAVIHQIDNVLTFQ